MKGLSETMLIIITVVVILVAALVLLAIFQGTIGPTGNSLQCQAKCTTQKLDPNACQSIAKGAAPKGWTNTADCSCTC